MNPCINCNIIDKLYRPTWTCGRYDAATQSAIMYNLIAGFSFFFENKSAEIVGTLLTFSRGDSFTLDDLVETLEITKETLSPFIDELLNLGLLSDKPINDKVVTNYRKQLSTLNNNIEGIKENTNGLSIPVSDAEKAYINRAHKRIGIVMMELTYNCSEMCIHCYNPGATRNNREENHRNDRASLSLEQYKKIIDELYDEGTFMVCLTGGDPFSNPYAWDIIEYLYEKGIAFEIFTNGQKLIGQEERLASYFPGYVAVSIYSPVEEVHDSITRIKGSLKRSLTVIEKLHELHVPLILKCVIMQNNVNTYHGVLQIAQKLQAEVQFDCRLFDSVDGDTCVSHYLRLTPQQLQIAFRDRNSMYYVGKEVKGFGALPHDINEPACLTGTSSICITPEGFIIPCVCLHIILGDTKKQSVREIMTDNKTLSHITSLKISEYEECGQHEYCSFCILCPGLNYSEHGTMRKAAENNCYYAKVRFDLYHNLILGKDPLKGRTIEQALSDIDVAPPKHLKRLYSK